MATLDFAPLYRSSIGFDQLPPLFAHALKRDETGFPPYNIEKLADDQYRITLAVAGFTPDDIEIIREHKLLTVRGKVKESGPKTYLHHGIAGRAFARQFDLADHVEVTGATQASQTFRRIYRVTHAHPESYNGQASTWFMAIPPGAND